MDRPVLSRRTALSGIAALTAALAGCSALGAGSDGAHPVAAANWTPPVGERPEKSIGRLAESHPAALADAGPSGPVAVDESFLDARVSVLRPLRQSFQLGELRRRDLDVLLTEPGSDGLSVRVGDGVGEAAGTAVADSGLEAAGSVEGFDLYTGAYGAVGVGENAVVSSGRTYGPEYNRRVVEAVVSARAVGPRLTDAAAVDALFGALGDPLAANVPARLRSPLTPPSDPDETEAALAGFRGIAGSLSVDGDEAVYRGAVVYGSEHPVPEAALRRWLGLAEGSERPSALSGYDSVELRIEDRVATLVARQPAAEATERTVQPLPV